MFLVLFIFCHLLLFIPVTYCDKIDYTTVFLLCQALFLTFIFFLFFVVFCFVFVARLLILYQSFFFLSIGIFIQPLIPYTTKDSSIVLYLNLYVLRYLFYINLNFLNTFTIKFPLGNPRSSDSVKVFVSITIIIYTITPAIIAIRVPALLL